MAGDLTSFDAEAYKANLSYATGVNASLIALEVTSASVKVDALIVTSSYSEAENVSSVLAPLEAEPQKGLALLGVPIEVASAVPILPGCLLCIPPSPSAPPPEAPPPPPDWPLISLALFLGIVGLIIVGCVCWCYAIPKIVKPKLRKKKQEDITADTVTAIIEGGTAQPAEDLDPDIEMNPVAVENLKRRQEKEKERKRKAAKKAKEARKEEARRRSMADKGGNKRTSQRPGLMGMASSSGFLVVGAFAKLGIVINGKGGRPPPPKEDAKKVDLKTIDLEIEKEAKKAKEREEQELAEALRLRDPQFPATQPAAPSSSGSKGKNKAGAMGKLGLGGGAAAPPPAARAVLKSSDKSTNAQGKIKAAVVEIEMPDVGQTSSSGAAAGSPHGLPNEFELSDEERT